MAALSRREFLQRLAAAYAGATLSSCHGQGDRFAKELVCIHILHPKEFIPAPLLQRTSHVVPRETKHEYFNIGLPELVLCESQNRLLDAFQYFWPFSQSDFEMLRSSIILRYQKSTINAAQDIAEFASFLRNSKSRSEKMGANSAVILTFNDPTRQWLPDVVLACRESNVQELVIFKDPTIAPYLCEYPVIQKGFKRPPP